MKLMFAVIRDKDANMAIDALAESHIGVTKLATTGGFLRDGNTTLMIGAEDRQVDDILTILRQNCAKRSETEVIAPHGTGGVPTWNLGYTPIKVEVGGATVFILEMDTKTLCSEDCKGLCPKYGPGFRRGLFLPFAGAPPGGRRKITKNA